MKLLKLFDNNTTLARFDLLHICPKFKGESFPTRVVLLFTVHLELNRRCMIEIAILGVSTHEFYISTWKFPKRWHPLCNYISIVVYFLSDNKICLFFVSLINSWSCLILDSLFLVRFLFEAGSLPHQCFYIVKGYRVYDDPLREPDEYNIT